MYRDWSVSAQAFVGELRAQQRAMLARSFDGNSNNCSEAKGGIGYRDCARVASIHGLS